MCRWQGTMKTIGVRRKGSRGRVAARYSISDACMHVGSCYRNWTHHAAGTAPGCDCTAKKH